METQIFDHAKLYLTSKKSSKRNQNPSRYYYNSITNLKVSTQAKNIIFQKCSYKNGPAWFWFESHWAVFFEQTVLVPAGCSELHSPKCVASADGLAWALNFLYMFAWDSHLILSWDPYVILSCSKLPALLAMQMIHVNSLESQSVFHLNLINSPHTAKFLQNSTPYCCSVPQDPSSQISNALSLSPLLASEDFAAAIVAKIV